MAGQVEGKVALVTGGASGIGEAIVELFAREGATVIATDIDELRGPELAKRITTAGGNAIFLEQDVTSEERWVEIVAEIAKRYGRLDIMVSNAGIGIAVPSITDMTLSDWRKQNAINLDGVFLSVKHCLPLMRKTGGGSIVMMSSLAGLRGAPGLSAYSATKGGVRLFAKSIAMECAAAGDGIRVNSVHPGIIDTPIWGKIPTGATGAGQNAPIDPEERAKVATPLGRAGQAAEIASGVLYLASDASRYVTGSELVIDGGMNAGGVRGGRETRRAGWRPQGLTRRRRPCKTRLSPAPKRSLSSWRTAFMPPHPKPFARTGRTSRPMRSALRVRILPPASGWRRATVSRRASATIFRPWCPAMTISSWSTLMVMHSAS